MKSELAVDFAREGVEIAPISEEKENGEYYG